MGELEHLGESAGFGSVLIALLEAAGWTVYERPAFGGGVLLTAVGHGTSVGAAAMTKGEASFVLFERVMALKKWRDKAAA